MFIDLRVQICFLIMFSDGCDDDDDDHYDAVDVDNQNSCFLILTQFIYLYSD